MVSASPAAQRESRIPQYEGGEVRTLPRQQLEGGHDTCKAKFHAFRRLDLLSIILSRGKIAKDRHEVSEKVDANEMRKLRDAL